MKRLHCPTCGNEVFFDSLRCVRSGTELTIGFGPDAAITVTDALKTVPCLNRSWWSCNWAALGDSPVCRSCILVDAGRHGDDPRMTAFQLAQRRALYQLTQLGMPWDGPAPAPTLRFVYRSNGAGDGAVIGHRDGEITLDLDEADLARREEIRTWLGELYRTPLGHLRHELGHFVWLTQVAPDELRRSEFRRLFGDETVDYAAALDAHYARADDGSWREHYASFYASAHPWEDFAESWAQLMHVHDVVETGASWGVVDAPADPDDAHAWVATSITASLAANELARAMGAGDLYPFTLSPAVRAKISYCWRLLRL